MSGRMVTKGESRGEVISECSWPGPSCAGDGWGVRNVPKIHTEPCLCLWMFPASGPSLHILTCSYLCIPTPAWLAMCYAHSENFFT